MVPPSTGLAFQFESVLVTGDQLPATQKVRAGAARHFDVYRRQAGGVGECCPPTACMVYVRMLGVLA